MSYFLGKDGVFMWSSIAAIVSGIVLIFQVFQFFYQKHQISKLKKFDLLVEFRMNDLNKLKEYVIAYDDFFSLEIIGSTGKNFESNESINMLLNIENQYYNELSESIRKFGVLSLDAKDMNSEERVTKLLACSTELIKNYKLYENKEIKMIEKYI